MSRRFSARRYAQALFELGGAEGKLDKWRSDLEKVAMLGTDPEVVVFLEHPRITQATKSKILSKAAGEIDPEILNLVYIMKARHTDRVARSAGGFSGIDRTSAGNRERTVGGASGVEPG